MSYPIVLTRLEQHRCVVVGGGQVAERKLKALIEAGATPVVISPDVTPEIERMQGNGAVSVIHRRYRPGDLNGAWLVIAATNDRETNEAIAAECSQEGSLLNVVDVPDLCNFTVPAVIRRGNLSIAVSTRGQAPAFAGYMRRTLEATVDEAYGDMLDLVSALRPVIRRSVSAELHARVWEELLDGRVLDCIRREGIDAARRMAEGMVESQARKRNR